MCVVEGEKQNKHSNQEKEMTKFKLTMLLMASMVFALFTFGCSNDDDSTSPVGPSTSSGQSAVRVIHTSYDAPAVDIRVDGSVAIPSLAYGESSGYAAVPSGTRNIKVSPAGATNPIVIEADLNLDDQADYTVFAVDALGSIGAVVAMDDRSPSSSMAKIRFLHAAPDAPAVDIRVNSGNGPVVFSNVSFKDIESYVQVAPGSYTFVVTPAGSTTELFVFDPISVSSGGVFTVVAHGTLAADSYDFAVRVFIDNNAGNTFADLTQAVARALVVHASPDAPGVALLVDNITVNSSALTFPQNTGYLPIAAGLRNIKVNAFGSSLTVIDKDLALKSGGNYSVFAVDYLSNIDALVLGDDLTDPMSGKAHVRFVHLSPDAPAVDITLTDGTIVFGQNAFLDYTAFTPLDAGTYDLQVRVAGTDTVALDLPGIALENGKVYTVFAKGLLAGSGDQALGAATIVHN